MLSPHTESRLVTLRPAGVEDAAQVYEILFRLGSAGLPLIDQFVESFGEGKAACFLVHRKDTGQLIGVSSLSDLAPAGHVRAEIELVAESTDELRAEVNALTVNFAFAMWRTRKVYFHLTTPDAGELGLGADLPREEVVLSDYTYFHGRLWDVHVVAIYREDWDEAGLDIIKQIV
ncbi:hypothetical protein PV458_42815 [Streptomyces sp. MN03-5084-2B]|jgi:hypothetical protein|nr:hypothetical protein [Streptomyces sp. MN03-5084-2B]